MYVNASVVLFICLNWIKTFSIETEIEIVFIVV